MTVAGGWQLRVAAVTTVDTAADLQLPRGEEAVARIPSGRMRTIVERELDRVLEDSKHVRG